MGGIFGGGGSTVNIPAPQQANVAQLQSQALGASQQNLTSSLGLQSQIFPGLNAGQNAAINTVTSNINNPVQFNPASVASLGANPALASANNFISGTNQSLLNGQLPADVQNQVLQSSGASAYQSGLRGAGGANVSAADLGLTSLQLQNQGFQNALAAGQTTQTANLAQQQLQTSINQFNSQYGASVALQGGAQAQSGLGLLSGISLPASGLTPSDIATISLDNTNTTNAYNQQAAVLSAQQQNASKQGFGSLLGLGLSAGGQSALSGLANGASNVLADTIGSLGLAIL